MGLDQYLKVVKRVSADAEKELIASICKKNQPSPFYSIEIIFTVYAFKRATYIHEWIEANCSAGNTDEWEITRDELIQLQELCQKTADTRDETLLADYSRNANNLDEWFDDVEMSASDLKDVLEENDTVWYKYEISY